MANILSDFWNSISSLFKNDKNKEKPIFEQPSLKVTTTSIPNQKETLKENYNTSFLKKPKIKHPKPLKSKILGKWLLKNVIFTKELFEKLPKDEQNEFNNILENLLSCSFFEFKDKNLNIYLNIVFGHFGYAHTMANKWKFNNQEQTNIFIDETHSKYNWYFKSSQWNILKVSEKELELCATDGGQKGLILYFEKKNTQLKK